MKKLLIIMLLFSCSKEEKICVPCTVTTNDGLHGESYVDRIECDGDTLRYEKRVGNAIVSQVCK